jgi:uncharacterized protein YutD
MINFKNNDKFQRAREAVKKAKGDVNDEDLILKEYIKLGGAYEVLKKGDPREEKKETAKERKAREKAEK